MRVSGKVLGSLLAGALTLAGLSSCRKPSETLKSDLEEAGYQLTVADWFRATRANDVPALKKFISSGFAADSKDDAGDSALHAAAATGSEATADFLLDRGLSIDLRGASDRTPLMAAIAGDQTAMVRWLLRQGADPRAKDKEGFMPLMLAVREGKSGSVAELAPYSRENLDTAILLAAMIGQTEVIDTLTNYGASVYARMEDGRTPLMIAAENGHADSVKLLLDIGASRFSTDTAGRSAADLASSAGHAEIAAIISREPLPEELALETPADVAKSMNAFVDAAIAATPATPAGSVAETSNGEIATASINGETSAPTPSKPSPGPARPIQGEVLSAAVASSANSSSSPAVSQPSNASPAPPDTSTSAAASARTNEAFPLPPLVMRHYRERELPVQIRSVEGENATIVIAGKDSRDVTLSPGQTLPGSSLKVLRVQRRMEDSKLNLGQAMEVSVVEVQDTRTQATREWISGVPSSAHDPIALVEDAATGQRYTATPGQRFTSADGSEFIITDVRPNQIVIEDATSGAVQTIPLRGPRG